MNLEFDAEGLPNVKLLLIVKDPIGKITINSIHIRIIRSVQSALFLISFIFLPIKKVSGTTKLEAIKVQKMLEISNLFFYFDGFSINWYRPFQGNLNQI